MKYQIQSADWSGAVAVPGNIIDRHLKLAPSASFKVLLYLLKKSVPQQEREIALATGLGEGEVADCLEYWMRAGVLQQIPESAAENAAENARKSDTAVPASPPKAGFVPEGSEPSPSVQPCRAEEAAPLCANTPPCAEPEKPVQEVFRPLPVKRPTQSEIARRLTESEELRAVTGEAQSIVGTFGYDTQALLVMIYDYYGFPPEVILMLLQYQKQTGNLSSAAIRSRAQSWAKEGITTLGAAEEEIRALDSAEAVFPAVRDCLGLKGEHPSASLLKYLRVWKAEWNLSDELVLFALTQGGKSVTEANKLLKKWEKKGIQTVEQARALERTAIPDKKPGRSYDLGQVGRNSVLERLRSNGEIKS